MIAIIMIAPSRYPRLGIEVRGLFESPDRIAADTNTQVQAFAQIEKINIAN